MIVGIPKEFFPEEKRVAAVPETVVKMLKAGMKVLIESGAGLLSYIEDEQYEKAGAKIEISRPLLFNQASIILKVHRPIFDKEKNLHEIDSMKEKTILISPLFPLQNLSLVEKLAAKGITTFSLDLLPRIARTQSMDILSSMSNIAGYKSVIMAANHLSTVFPMMTTAAGTIPPTKVIVVGAGVAGLQAIATARRLGAVVLAFDVRTAVAEQVRSIGADFVSLETSHQSENSGGYAEEQSIEFYKKEQEILGKYLKDADVVITTALIPGKSAPLLITDQMVREMKPGSVIVDLAAEQKGNCVLTECGKIVVKYGITIIGVLNIPSLVPIQASQLYSRNLFAFLNYIAPALNSDPLDCSDEIIKSTLVTHHGEILHPIVKKAIQQAGECHVC